MSESCAVGQRHVTAGAPSPSSMDVAVMGEYKQSCEGEAVGVAKQC